MGLIVKRMRIAHQIRADLTFEESHLYSDYSGGLLLFKVADLPNPGGNSAGIHEAAECPSTRRTRLPNAQ